MNQVWIADIYPIDLSSVHPPPPLPRWAATLKFVIPTGEVMSLGPTQGDEKRGSDRSVHPSVTAAKVSAALSFVIPSELRISYYGALVNDHVCGFLLKESRMRSTETTKPDRKSGGGRGICSSFPPTTPSGSVFRPSVPGGDSPTRLLLRRKVKLQVPALRFGRDDKFEGGGTLAVVEVDGQSQPTRVPTPTLSPLTLSINYQPKS